MPPRRPRDYVGRYGLLLVLMSVPYFSVAYLSRVVGGAEFDTALLALVAYMLLTTAENVVSVRVCPPTWLLLTSLLLDYLCGVAGALLPRATSLTLLAVGCAAVLLGSWWRGVRAILERGWLIRRALASGDPELVRLAQARQRYYARIDQSLVEYGWTRSE